MVIEVKQIKLFMFYVLEYILSPASTFLPEGFKPKKHKQLDLFHLKYCGWITKWSRSCVYVLTQAQLLQSNFDHEHKPDKESTKHKITQDLTYLYNG